MELTVQEHGVLALLAMAACAAGAVFGRIVVIRLAAQGMAMVQAALAGLVVRMFAAVPLLTVLVLGAPRLVEASERTAQLAAAAWAAGAYAVFTVFEAVAAAGRLQRPAA